MIEQIVKDYKKDLFNSPSEIRKKLDFFRDLSKKGLHNFTEKEIEEIKTNFIKFININMTFWVDTYPTKLFRVTNNKYLYGGEKVKLQIIDDLLGPPLNESYYGRCNLPNESVFYSALDFKTAIWETKPEVGDLITVSEWQIKDGEKLNTHNIFNPNVFNLSKESKDAYKAWIDSKNKRDSTLGEIFEDVMLFFTEEFMKVVDSDKKENYLFSSILSSRFLQAKNDENGFKIEAIVYPSVKMQYGLTNLAISNDLVLKKLNLNSITIYEIMETNYDEKNVHNDDLIKVSPLIIKTTDFDIINNKINYDEDAEFRQMIELHQKYREDIN
ncbi:hypothetical protein [Flavobacterium eburneipallidum]|uniref:hypothetical protein n=1 Tax=Flavobacterium eburneipallidum TaxID=3003263 RepID=UPI002482CAD2|nr:hypothetical protein [Flavobacterium eburneipallidum]